MSFLSKTDLMFLLDELDVRRIKRLESSNKYHKTQKGIEARKRASAKYYRKTLEKKKDFSKKSVKTDVGEEQHVEF